LFSEESVFRGLLDHWLETIRSLSWGNRNYTVALCTSLLTMAHREMPPSGTEKQFDDLQIVQLLHECETFAGLCRCIREQLGLLRMKIHGRSGTKEAVQIAQVKAYIDEHYAEEISLETMASRFYMNPSYFSTFFKKNTGLNFKQYVTDARMKAALHMLTQTDAMLYEIAEKIGYHHARQFSEMFKKQFGMLPGEYRKRAEGEREEAEA
jgi:two-component system response regulator YesN